MALAVESSWRLQPQASMQRESSSGVAPGLNVPVTEVSSSDARAVSLPNELRQAILVLFQSFEPALRASWSLVEVVSLPRPEKKGQLILQSSS